MNKLKMLGLLLASSALLSLVGCTRNGMPKKQSNARTRVDHLIIKEIFYVGHSWRRETPEDDFPAYNDLYNDDQYLTIYNPTGEVKYLDGLAICSSAMDPSEVLEFAPKDDFRNKYFGASAFMCFPGSGTEYPVQPGQTIVVAKYAIDHQQAYLQEMREGEEEEGGTFNASEYKGLEAFLDLSKADFEWTNVNYLSSDEQAKNNPNVPDMEPLLVGTDKWGKSSASFAFRQISERAGLALVRLPWTKEDFKENYLDKREDHTAGSGASTAPQAGQAADQAKRGYLHYISVVNNDFADFFAIEVPFDNVLDCVTICPKSEFKQRITKLDRGYNAISERFTRRLRSSDKQKVSGIALIRRWDGRKFVDDDNSTRDFQQETASLSRRDDKGNVIK